MKINNSKLTVFVGVYNGLKFLDSLRSQIESQTFQDYEILVLDNASEDGSWEVLQNWQESFGERIQIFQNEKNLGGGGSLARALAQGLIKTPWFTCLHQDDHYFPEHIETLQREIFASDDDVVAVCSSMKSMNSQGEFQPPPPRAMWLLTDNSQVNSFLLNLRTQALSFPSAAFKTESFKICMAPWHSPTFSDTETTLLLCGVGKIGYIQKETMAYRENPHSESHTIRPLESVIGTTLGLSRVFTSQSFRHLLALVEENNRTKFFEELMSCIEIRIPESSLQNFIKMLATEECCRAFGYSEEISTQTLAERYKVIGSEFTSKLLLAGSSRPKIFDSEGLKKSFENLANFESQVVFNSSVRKSRMKSIGQIAKHLPLPFRRTIFAGYVKLKSIKQPNFYWNAFWR